jgi:hypothetical protein
MAKRNTISVPSDRDSKDDPLAKVYKAVERFISKVPETDEHKSKDPFTRARWIVNAAAAKAALVSGGLALPPGPLGFLTILPDLIAIWKIQAQMVSDIAGVFGKTGFLSREQMVYCLFKHSSAQLVRDLVVRVGQRYTIRRASVRAIQKVVRKVAAKVTQRTISRSISRWLPIVGAVGVSAYAYYDTAQVGTTAIDLFSNDIELEGKGEPGSK